MWNVLSDKSIVFPSTSTTVLVVNANAKFWDPGKYSLIRVDKLLEICDKPYCEWTHWMKIPKIE